MTYLVQPQDTLYSIAWRHNLDYRALARWNGIGSDYRISVGQILSLQPGTPPAETYPVKRAPPGVATAPPAQGPALGRWTWPTAALESPQTVAGGGLLLQGVLGQPVRAACNGRIVYVGDGIRGYGNLIIIKHDDNFLSAYAHTRAVTVHEGEDVLRGQDIAQMDFGPHQSPALYFEIRFNGKPVDPLPYLTGQR